jgi:hypothetical protein
MCCATLSMKPYRCINNKSTWTVKPQAVPYVRFHFTSVESELQLFGRVSNKVSMGNVLFWCQRSICTMHIIAIT